MPQSADKKPERYVGPDGKSKIRMVPVDREIVHKEAAPKIDPVKFAAHLAKNERPKKMTSTQKTLADIRKRADKRAEEKYTAPTQAERDADKKKDRNAQRAAGIKRPSMTPGSLKRKQYSGMMGKLKRESVEEVQNESVNEISRSMTPMNKRFGKTVDPKKFDAYKKFVKKNNVDEPTVRMIRDNPDAAESKRMMKNKNVAQAVSLYKASMKESVNLDEKLKVSDGMGSWIKDFQGSDAPQFKGKDKEERRDMAIAAYLSAKKGN
jgi:hypothetical protein